MLIEIKNRFTGNIIISGDYESVKDCLARNRDADLRGAYLRGADLTGADPRDAYLRGADLRGADLTDADLRGADLTGADLTDADLRGAKGYVGSHDYFAEAVRRQKVTLFIQAEWVAIAQERILLHILWCTTSRAKWLYVVS